LPSLKSWKGPALVTMLNKAAPKDSQHNINQSEFLLSWFGVFAQKSIYTTSHNAIFPLETKQKTADLPPGLRRTPTSSYVSCEQAA